MCCFTAGTCLDAGDVVTCSMCPVTFGCCGAESPAQHCRQSSIPNRLTDSLPRMSICSTLSGGNVTGVATTPQHALLRCVVGMHWAAGAGAAEQWEFLPSSSWCGLAEDVSSAIRLPACTAACNAQTSATGCMQPTQLSLPAHAKVPRRCDMSGVCMQHVGGLRVCCRYLWKCRGVGSGPIYHAPVQQQQVDSIH